MNISNTVSRSFSILELLSTIPAGLGVSDISETLSLPKSTVHRLLGDLQQLGYIVFDDILKIYRLSFKLAQLGFKSLSSHSVYEAAQPMLNEIASLSGELVRLSFVQNQRLIFLAKAQGRSAGLRVDADMGNEAYLGYSASGMAWLSTLEKGDAWDLIHQQLDSFPDKELFSQQFILDKAAFFAYLSQVKKEGYSVLTDTMGIGTTAIAAPFFKNEYQKNTAIGVISIAGPTIRFTQEKIDIITAILLEKTQALSLISTVAPFRSY